MVAAVRPLKLIAVLIAGSLFLTGCNPGKKTQDSPGTSPKAQLAADLKGLGSLNVMTLNTYDQSSNGLFSKIFGGTSGSAIRQYMAQRIQFYLTPEETDSFRTVPSDVSIKAFFEDPDADKKLKDAGGEVGAYNAGTSLWYMGIVNNVSITLYHGKDSFPIESPRIGIMVIGAGYRSTVTTGKGQVIALPPVYRQATLVHEARHSDCTGGITADDIAFLKTSKSMPETMAGFKKAECGHLHAFCTSGDLKGITACDGHAWGAYGIELVFIKALVDSYSGQDRAIVDYMVIDTASRLLVDSSAMLDGRLGAPDMSSSGLQ